jgi:hypothetical protein
MSLKGSLTSSKICCPVICCLWRIGKNRIADYSDYTDCAEDANKYQRANEMAIFEIKVTASVQSV